MRIVLASRSPRRKEILERLGLVFDVLPSSVHEDLNLNGNPAAEVVRLASEKALDVSGKMAIGDALIIGVDTVVYLEEKILGQPQDREHAKEMLLKLQGRTHDVYSGLSLIRKNFGEAKGFSVSKVTFSPMSEAEVEWYVDDGEPMDKAGAYGVQGKGALFISGIEGSFHNVMGFPVDLFYCLLPKLKLDFPAVCS
jgi:septum formation protein